MRLQKCELDCDEAFIHVVLSRSNLNNLIQMLDSNTQAKIISYNYDISGKIIVSAEEDIEHKAILKEEF